ncbi:MAG: HTTM domain-containing protein [Methylotenera sp.]|nr:HTTM domain-containing protein [Oligoflexia bacterium]
MNMPLLSPFTDLEALSWTQKLIGVAVFLQTIELLQLRSKFNETGIWKWSTLQREFQIFPRPVFALLDFLLGYRNFIAVLFLRLIASATVIFFPHPALFLFLLLSTVLISLRWRGTFNGGSDFMTLIVLMGVSGATVFREIPIVRLACLGYIAIQTCTSYFIAGFIKMKTSNWRRGKALPGFLNATIHDGNPLLNSISRNRVICLAASWAVIVFECGFPSALLNPQLCVVLIGLGFLFHLGTWIIFGLNRFLFAWMAAYPALYYCSQLHR